MTRNKLRHYEREGLIKPLRKKHGDREYRYYCDDDIENVRVITRFISLSWSAREVSEFLKFSTDLNEVIKKMKNTHNFLLEKFKGNIEGSKDEEVKNLVFWKDFKADNPDNTVNRVIEQYSNFRGDRGEILSRARLMQDAVNDAKNILSEYLGDISAKKDEVRKVIGDISYLMKQ